MEASATENVRKDGSPLFPFIWACAITFLLFFMDEGYYDLRWMKDPRGWFWFFIYVTGFMFFQSIIYMALSWYKGRHRMKLSISLGILLGFVVVFIIAAIK